MRGQIFHVYSDLFKLKIIEIYRFLVLLVIEFSCTHCLKSQERCSRYGVYVAFLIIHTTSHTYLGD